MAEGDAFEECLKCNQTWAAETAKSEPEFFANSAKGQAPAILWLGCADSRVPETTVLGLKPGQVFTHRNIANIINATDVSMLSIVQYAVFHIKVKHIVVCGHTYCGGVAASLANSKLDVLDVWLQPLRALREKHADELAKLDEKERGNYLSKANVRAGVEVLKRIPTVIDAIQERGLEIHGIIYDLASGLIEEVDTDEHEEHASKRIAAFARS